MLAPERPEPWLSAAMASRIVSVGRLCPTQSGGSAGCFCAALGANAASRASTFQLPGRTLVVGDVGGCRSPRDRTLTSELAGRPCLGRSAPQKQSTLETGAARLQLSGTQSDERFLRLRTLTKVNRDLPVGVPAGGVGWAPVVDT